MFTSCNPVGVTNCVFAGNSAGYHGGAMFDDRVNVVTTATDFADNRACIHGSAVYTYACSPQFLGNVFTGNQTTVYHGGAIFSDSCTLTATIVSSPTIRRQTWAVAFMPTARPTTSPTAPL